MKLKLVALAISMLFTASTFCFANDAYGTAPKPAVADNKSILNAKTIKIFLGAGGALYGGFGKFFKTHPRLQVPLILVSLGVVFTALDDLSPYFDWIGIGTVGAGVLRLAFSKSGNSLKTKKK